MPAGRPISLDEKRRAAIGDVLAAGAPIKTTAAACGIGERTLHRWLKCGRVARPTATGNRLPPVPAPRLVPKPLSLLELLDELRGGTS